MINTNPGPSFTVTVVRDERSWCAAVVGVEDAVAWGDDFEELESAIRSKLSHLAADPELTWQIDGGDETGREVPLNPM